MNRTKTQSDGDYCYIMTRNNRSFGCRKSHPNPSIRRYGIASATPKSIYT